MSMKNCVDCASCPVRLPEETAREVDALAKTLPQGLEFQRKALPVEYQFEPGERAEVSILTSRSVDKSAEVVLPEGLELESYRKSAIVLWNHDKDRPIASCGWIKLHKDHIRAKTIYPERPQDVETNWFTDEVWAMTKSSPPILRCKSIGFLPLVPLRDASPEELQAHPEWEGAGVWEKTLLLEYSCVYSGCNEDALVVAVNTKSLDPERLKLLGVEVPHVPEEVKEPCCTNRLERFKATNDCVSRKIEFLAKEKPEMSEEQRIAVAYAYCGEKKQKRKVKKEINVDEVLKEIAARVNVQKIDDRAVHLYRNRGRA